MLRWSGHVIRMENGDFVKRVYESNIGGLGLAGKQAGKIKTNEKYITEVGRGV